MSSKSTYCQCLQLTGHRNEIIFHFLGGVPHDIHFCLIYNSAGVILNNLFYLFIGSVE